MGEDTLPQQSVGPTHPRAKGQGTSPRSPRKLKTEDLGLPAPGLFLSLAHAAKLHFRPLSRYLPAPKIVLGTD